MGIFGSLPAIFEWLLLKLSCGSQDHFARTHVHRGFGQSERLGRCLPRTVNLFIVEEAMLVVRDSEMTPQVGSHSVHCETTT